MLAASPETQPLGGDLRAKVLAGVTGIEEAARLGLGRPAMVEA
ncbi:MAG: hypothetical protein AAF577_00240 [Pseudomonadota bacterium]